uniref:Pentatricopeptide repeat-containing protein n=1 Tax=Tanacetum cinerariifolium TaxID=118510 RepID=A0A6L2KVX6_TANCI|nr:hypothetical protein [Tanacetum cinerariifolium]
MGRRKYLIKEHLTFFEHDIRVYCECDVLEVTSFKKTGNQVSVSPALQSALVFGYARKGLVKEAREKGRCFEAVEVFKEICLPGFKADGTTVSCVLSAVGELGCGSAMEMLRVFDEMGCKDVGACNVLILGFSRNGLTNEALEVCKRLRSQEPELSVLSWTCVIAKPSRRGLNPKPLACGFKVDGTTASSVLSAVGELGDLGVLYDTWCGSAMEMLRVFDAMGCKDVGACNALISGFSRNGLTDEALEVFKRLRSQEQELNVVS